MHVQLGSAAAQRREVRTAIARVEAGGRPQHVDGAYTPTGNEADRVRLQRLRVRTAGYVHEDLPAVPGEVLVRYGSEYSCFSILSTRGEQIYSRD